MTVPDLTVNGPLATAVIPVKAHLSGNLTLRHCRMSAIQPAWDMSTTASPWWTKRWHFGTRISVETKPARN